MGEISLTLGREDEAEIYFRMAAEKYEVMEGTIKHYGYEEDDMMLSDWGYFQGFSGVIFC